MQAGGMGCQIAKERRLALKGVLKVTYKRRQAFSILHRGPHNHWCGLITNSMRATVVQGAIGMCCATSVRAAVAAGSTYGSPGPTVTARCGVCALLPLRRL